MWEWLSEPQNREVFSWVGGGLAAALAGLWAVYRHWSRRNEGTGPSLSVQARHGVAAGGNIEIGRDLEIGRPGSGPRS